MLPVWYVLEDGTAADPNTVAPDAQGVLRHVSGVAVAYGPHGPRSTGVDLGAVSQDAAAPAAARPPRPRQARPAADRKMAPKPPAAYETR